ncbi:MAG: hypothetical protein IPM24_14120 [Bryobacterales bacterium]|nr:hypothetical protein [Bryobacterales bacterium]
MPRALLLLLLAATLAQADFRFGRAAIPITPTAETGGVKEVLDELHAKAVVFEGDGVLAAIVICDLPVIGKPVVEEARRRIEAATGIPGAHVMIAATHTHTGLTPGWAGVSSFPALFPTAAGPEAEQAGRYREFLLRSITEAVRRAYEGRTPARVSAAIGREDSLPFNRRFRMKNGTVVFNPGVRNPEILRPVGPVDPAVPVVLVTSTEGKPLATLVNYALHLDTVGRDAYSADYVWPLSRVLGETMGPEMLTVFSIGTAGNVNHIDVTRPRPAGGETARIGSVLAAEVLRTLRHAESVETPSVRVTRETVFLPPVEVRPGELEQARALAERERNGGRLTLLERVFAQRIFFAEEQAGEPLQSEVMAIALGNEVAWVALPGEIFVELGLAIKNGSPFRFTVVNELAFDWIRYVPNRKGLREGGYEAINTRCGEGCGEMLADAAVRCLLRLHQAPQQPWSSDASSAAQ